MEHDLVIREADVEDINTIGYLAQQIWPVAYREILSADQMQYMLNRLYSPAALQEQIEHHHHHFLIAELQEPVGFASYSKISPEVYKLHKLYLMPTTQGKGLGKAVLDYIVEEIKQQGALSLLLNVNRNNKAKGFYERYGFKVIREEDVDIGNNYFMNDYVMEKKL